MKRSWLMAAAFVAASSLASPRYAGSQSTEAILTFSHAVEFEAATAPLETDVRRKIDRQLLHLFGSLAAASHAGVPRSNHVVSNVVVGEVKDGRVRATYDYRGTIVLHVGAGSQIPVVLPRDPAAIYKQGLVYQQGKVYAPCTDPSHSDAGSFWYFWNPRRQGCRLREGVHFVTKAGAVQRLANTTVTYPDYPRLIDATTREIAIHSFFGPVVDGGTANPYQSSDYNAQNFRRVGQSLQQLGYSRRLWSAEEIAAVTGGVGEGFVEEWQRDAALTTIRVRMFFGPVGFGGGAKAFHYFLRDAVEHAAVMAYDGHSGMGMNLDLASIEKLNGFKITPPPERYQLYFFNSCSSYPYYATQYFARKTTASDPRGTWNLDILTNGLETMFAVMAPTNLAVVRAITDWAEQRRTWSYQELARLMDSQNLFGVNGDEDNPTVPPVL